jgi:GxxExxY protein
MNFKYSEITEKVIGAAMQVHCGLGNGFREVIYQRALAFEMKENGLIFEKELNIPIYYKGEKMGVGRVDFLIEKKIMVEIKAFINLENGHLVQAKNYLEAYNLEVGLLINFGAPSLQFKRIVNNKYRNPFNP